MADFDGTSPLKKAFVGSSPVVQLIQGKAKKKHFEFSTPLKPAERQALATFFQSLAQNDLKKLTLQEPLIIKPQGQEKLLFSEYNVSFEARPAEADKQRQEFYLDDVIQLILELVSWITSHPGEFANKEILKESAFEAVSHLATQPISEIVNKKTDVKEAIELLLKVIGINEVTLTAAKNASSLFQLREILRTNHASILDPENIWNENVLPLAQAFNRAPTQTSLFPTNIPLAEGNFGQALISESRDVFRLAIEALRDILEKPNLLPEKTRGKTIKELLTTDQIKAIESDNLLFAEEVDALSRTAGDEDNKNQTDEQTIKNLLRWLKDEEVINILRGEKILKPTEVAAASETAEETGGGE